LIYIYGSIIDIKGVITELEFSNNNLKLADFYFNLFNIKDTKWDEITYNSLEKYYFLFIKKKKLGIYSNIKKYYFLINLFI